MQMETGQGAATVFTELAEAGFPVARVGELRLCDYHGAVPILLRWLPRADDSYLRWAIVGALGVKWARPVAAPALIEEFRRAPDYPYGYKWAVGAALAEVADEGVWEDLLSLVCDPRHGHAREMVVAAFGHMRQPRAVDVLIALLADEDAAIALQALRALGVLGTRATRARPHVTSLAAHSDHWVRRAAGRALARIDRASERAHGTSRRGDGQDAITREGRRPDAR